MKLKDLETKMVVKTRNMDMFLVVDNFLINRSDCISKDMYKEDLTANLGRRSYDIMEVYKPKEKLHLCSENFDDIPKSVLIWSAEASQKTYKKTEDEKEMNLAGEIKIEDGMVIELRDKGRYMVEKGIFIGHTKFIGRAGYCDRLKHEILDEEYDIVKIFSPKNIPFDMLTINDISDEYLVWSEGDTVQKEITKENKKEVMSMKLKDLKTKMVIQTRSMGRFLVVDDVFIGADYHITKDEYYEDLTAKLGNCSQDIVKVYKPRHNKDLYIENLEDIPETDLVWSQVIEDIKNEVEELTGKYNKKDLYKLIRKLQSANSKR